MKKIISIFLAMLMTFACFGAVSVSAAEATITDIQNALPVEGGDVTVYVVAGGTGDGSSEEKAAGSMKDVLQAVQNKYSSTTSTTLTVQFSGDYVWDISGNYTMPITYWKSSVTIQGKSITDRLIFNCTAWTQFFAPINFTFDNCTIAALGNEILFGTTGYTLNFGVNSIDVLAKGQTITVNSESKTTSAVSVQCINNAGDGVTRTWSGMVTLLDGNYDYVYGVNQFDGTVSYQNEKLLVIGEKANVAVLIAFRLRGSASFSGNKDTNKPVNIDINGTVNNFFLTNRTTTTGYTFDGKVTLKFGPKAKVNLFSALSTSNNFIFGETGTVAGGMHFKGGFTVDVSEMTDSANVKKILETVKTWKEGVLSGMEVVHVKPVALQAGAATDSSIRILLGINAYEGLNASVEIKETSSVKAATVELTEVYTSVLAVTGTEITTVTAADKGVAYLMAVVITDLPVGVYTFAVTPIVNGVRGTTTTITHTVTASAT